MRSNANGLLALLLLTGAAAIQTGCKSSSAPQPAGQTASGPAGVRNSDGSITNADGSVTYPAGVRPPGWSGPAAAATTVPAGSTVAAQPVPGQQPYAGQPGANQGYAPAAGGCGQGAAAANTVAPARTALTVPAGTAVVVRLNGGLAASRNEVGDRFSGVLDRPLTVRGERVYASGTAVSGEVVASKGKGRFKGAGDLGIELTAIGRDHVSTSMYEKVAKGRGKRTGGFIGGGAGLGALIGGLAGGGKGAVIGGLAGAGAGTAAGAYTGSRDVVIPAESVITFRLRSALTR